MFGRDLASGIGLSRTGLGIGFFLSTVMLALALPLGGALIDRFGPRWPAVMGSIALSAGFVLLGTVVASPAMFILVMAATGFFAATSAPVAYTRAVNLLFSKGRGLALGLTQMGIGVSAMVVPPFLALTIARDGWQAGYLWLACIALAGVIPAVCLPNVANPSRAEGTAGSADFRSPVYRLLIASFGLMALSFAGLLTHFVPMLREAGMTPEAAGGTAGVIGLSVVVSRLIVGWLVDRVDAARVAILCCLLCAAGCVALAIGGTGAALIGAIALGTAMGAEADLIGYLTARYFGIGAYGRLYAVQYASFMLMAGLSPLWMGVIADRQGAYTIPLVMAAIGLAAASILFARLPRLGRA